MQFLYAEGFGLEALHSCGHSRVWHMGQHDQRTAETTGLFRNLRSSYEEATLLESSPAINCFRNPHVPNFPRFANDSDVPRKSVKCPELRSLEPTVEFSAVSNMCPFAQWYCGLTELNQPQLKLDKFSKLGPSNPFLEGFSNPDFCNRNCCFGM